MMIFDPKELTTLVEKSLPDSDKNNEIHYKCEYCGKQFAKKDRLIAHNQGVHMKSTFQCNICEFRTTRNGHLKTHKMMVHDGIKYPCTMCTYKATSKARVRMHQESFHEGKKFKLHDS